ncbi:S8 family serine peptidase [Nocardioides marinquilinus]
MRNQPGRRPGHRSRPRRARWTLAGTAAIGSLAVAASLAAAPAAPASPAADRSAGAAASAAAPTRLYLVTLRSPGTTGLPDRGPVPGRARAGELLAQQDAVLADVDTPPPVYRWTTALNGFAVELDADQAALLAALPQVALVEPNEVQPLASAPDAAALPQARRRPAARDAGAGVVVGVVDTGLDPDSPLFAQLRERVPDRFAGPCEAGDRWSAGSCTSKVVGARWFVDGFGTDALRAASSLSPRDTDGHGTAMASIAAGNAAVPVQVAGERLGRFSGAAPEAQVAVYKACWSAPDPAGDGCATADVVSAVDAATRDGVDVLSLSVGGPSAIDTVDRALLGAVEGGVVVVAAAGNEGDRAGAAHPAPWVTTVGGTTDAVRRGRVEAVGGPRLGGVMVSQRGVPSSRLVAGSAVRARGASVADATVCAPGSLDAARVGGAVVVCERGGVARVDKSRAVALADGVGMVLVDVRGEGVATDAHEVPTVHLAAGPGRRLLRWLATERAPRVRLVPRGLVRAAPRVAPFSSSGSTTTTVVKPDVVAPGSGVLSATVPSGHGDWDFLSGTSPATAHTAGVAATLLGRGLRPSVVRSALVTSAAPLASTPVLDAGAGRVRLAPAQRTGLAYVVEPRRYRAWLEGRRPRLNTASVLLAGGALQARREITNVTGRRLYFSSSAQGFRRDVTVRPAAVRLAPGETATFRVRVAPGRGRRLDDGFVVWRGATGTVTRIPVVVAR